MVSTAGPAGDPTPRSRGRDGTRVRLALASDLRLLAEAISAALASRQIQVTILDWPRIPREDPVERQLRVLEPDVGLLVYDLDMSLRMVEARSLLGSVRVPWLVLTGTPEGTVWGGLRDAGAAAVRTRDAGLDEVETALRRLATGGRAPEADRLDEHLASWREIQVRHADVHLRLGQLTPRERQVLELMRQGVSVRGMGVLLGLSESTVRSRVRAILRKLGVRSQLAAVALLRAVDRPGDAETDR